METKTKNAESAAANTSATVTYGVLLDDLGSIDEYPTRAQAESINARNQGFGVVRITVEKL